MEYRIQTPEPWKRVLEVSVPASEVRLEVDRLSDYYSRRTKLDGFRAGKVPPQLVKARHFSKLQEEATDKVIQEAYTEALEKSKLSPITNAKVSDVSFNPEGELSFRTSFEIIPDIKVGQYKKIRCTKKVGTIVKTRVDKELERLRESIPILKSVARKIRKNDAVVIDLKVYHESRLVNEIAQSTIFVKNMSKEVRTKLIGRGAGDKVSFKDSNKVTRISIKEVKEPVYPEVDDNFAKDLGFEDIKSLTTKIRKELKKAEELRSEREVEDQVVRHLIDKNPFDPPSSLVELRLDEISANPEERRNYRGQAIYLVKREIILDKIASLENISVDEEEIGKKIEEIAKTQNISAEQLKTQLKRNGRIDVLGDGIRCNKALRFLVSEASVKAEKVKE